ncbi:hypothetical protein ACKKBF_B09855 [Auxenochlorella protothecoides x Auxenochlorella symbiontica]
MRHILVVCILGACLTGARANAPAPGPFSGAPDNFEDDPNYHPTTSPTKPSSPGFQSTSRGFQSTSPGFQPTTSISQPTVSLTPPSTLAEPLQPTTTQPTQPSSAQPSSAQCKFFLEQATCCAETGLTLNSAWASIAVYCTAPTIIPASCIRVEGPSNVTVVDTNVPSPAWGRTFRFVAGWTPDEGYVGWLTVGLETECALAVPRCSVGRRNYDAVLRPVADLEAQVEEAGQEEACPWRPSGLAWLDARSGECGMLEPGLLPQSLFTGINYLTPKGVQASCNATFF